MVLIQENKKMVITKKMTVIKTIVLINERNKYFGGTKGNENIMDTYKQ